jgi:hypothetical protein
MVTDPGVIVPIGFWLFLVLLPLCMLFWVVMFRALSLVPDVAVMPDEYRVVDRVFFPRGTDAPAVHPIWPAAVLVVVNLPVSSPLAGQAGMFGVLEALAYVVVQVLWVRRFWKARR